MSAFVHPGSQGCEQLIASFSSLGEAASEAFASYYDQLPTKIIDHCCYSALLSCAVSYLVFGSNPALLLTAGTCTLVSALTCSLVTPFFKQFADADDRLSPPMALARLVVSYLPVVALISVLATPQVAATILINNLLFSLLWVSLISHARGVNEAPFTFIRHSHLIFV